VTNLSRQRSLWGAFLAFTMLAAVPAHARPRHSDSSARQHFAMAERMREALNGRPPADRSHHDYQRVLNAYRYVYLGAPTSTKADPSVVAVAETLVEMGRRFNDDKILHQAIAQYRFLRREYPGSKYRFDALFTIGEIYKDDLNDSAAARAAFQEFVRRYPDHHLADDARQATAELDREAHDADRVALAQKSLNKKQLSKSSDDSKPEAAGNEEPSKEVAPADTASHPAPEKAGPAEAKSKRLARVTGIRHWSSGDYTRVAIDVEGDIKFSSQRIQSPARIFFDLRGTKLASTLVGKSFDVDDGFLKKVRVAQFAPGRTRVVLDVDNLSDYDAFLLPNPYRLIIDIHGKGGRAHPESQPEKDSGETLSAEADVAAPPRAALSAQVSSSPVKPGPALHSAGKADENQQEAPEAGDHPSASSTPPSAKPQTIVRKVVDADDDDTDDATHSAASSARMPHASSRAKSAPLVLGKAKVASDLTIREARPTASGDRSLIRALGLKIGKIVIDPGHGGHDTGTIGPHGLEEKDLVLEVGRRLGKLLETRLGAEVVYTRKDDTFIPLETRTAIANQARADLFVSIHANSSHDEDARGVETYYLNFTSSPEALEVAARENAVSEKSIYELQDLVKKIAMKEKIEESREFAWDVQQSLHSGLAAKSPAIRDRGVKKAPFIVLIGANMPSILAEISFVSNPTDEHRLATSEYRERIAESLYRGIARYVNGLSGVKVASKMEKASAQ